MSIEIKLYKKPLAMLTVAGSRARLTPGVLAKFSGVLSEKGINLECVSSGEYSISFYVSQKDGKKAAKILRDAVVKKSAFESLVQDNNLAMVSVSGKEFMDAPGMLFKLIEPLAKNKINMLGISTTCDSMFIFFDWRNGRKAFGLMSKVFRKGGL